MSISFKRRDSKKMKRTEDDALEGATS